MNDLYGNNWPNVGYKGVDHQTTDQKYKSHKLFIFGLEESVYDAAQPLGPLKNNRLIIENLFSDLTCKKDIFFDN